MVSPSRLFCTLLLVLLPALGNAAPWRGLSVLQGEGTGVPLYGSVFIDRQAIGISDSRFNSPLVSAAGGWWFRPGIAAEVEFGRSLSDDSLNDLSLEVFSLMSVNLRLESPPTSGVAAYALFGFSRTNINSSFGGTVNNRKKSAFRGARAALGLTVRLAPRLILDGAFTHHEYDDDIGINSFRVGLRYELSDLNK